MVNTTCKKHGIFVNSSILSSCDILTAATLQGECKAGEQIPLRFNGGREKILGTDLDSHVLLVRRRADETRYMKTPRGCKQREGPDARGNGK